MPVSSAETAGDPVYGVKVGPDSSYQVPTQEPARGLRPS